MIGTCTECKQKDVELEECTCDDYDDFPSTPLVLCSICADAYLRCMYLFDTEAWDNIKEKRNIQE